MTRDLQDCSENSTLIIIMATTDFGHGSELGLLLGQPFLPCVEFDGVEFRLG